MAVYLVCYDLLRTPDEQLDHVLYWLRYLNSLIAVNTANKKCKVILVGLRDDKNPKETKVEARSTWKFDNLEILASLRVSSHKKKNSLLELRNLLEETYKDIFTKDCKKISRSCRLLLENLHHNFNGTDSMSLTHIDSIVERWGTQKREIIDFGLKLLHDIGEIVYFKDGSISVDPVFVSNLMSNFISPSDVRSGLATEHPQANVSL